MTESYIPRESARAGRLRTAAVLALVALGTFAAIILAQLYTPSLVGLGAFGLVVIGFPLAALLAKGRP